MVKRTENLKNSICQIVRNKPLITFFVLSISISWIGLSLLVGLFGLDCYTFEFISGFSPSLSAVIISLVLNNKHSKPRPFAWLFTFILVMVIAGSVRWISRIWWHHNTDWSVIPGDFMVVALSAFIFASAFSSKNSVKALLRPYINCNIPIRWIIIAVFLWPAITLSGNFLAELVGFGSPAMPELPEAPIYLVIPVSFLWALFFNGSLGEEAGWRGFALPRLQQRFSPLVSSLIIGSVWALFHMIFFLLNLRSEPWYMLWIRLGDIPLAILFTWLYNRTKGKSLLPVLLMHASLNGALDYLPRNKIGVYSVLGIVILVVIFTDRMWIKNKQNYINTSETV